MTRLEDPKLELQFLGALADLSTYDMKEARAFAERAAIEPRDFTRGEHWIAYEATCKCISLGIPADASNLQRELVNCGSQQSIATVAAVTDGAAGYGLDGYYRSMKEISDRRHAVALLKDGLGRLERGEDVIETKSIIGNRLTHTRGRKTAQELGVFVGGALQHLVDVRDGKGVPVIPTGISELDEVIGGWQPTLNMVGAEPGVGKSALFASTIHSLADRGIKTAIFSLEDEPSWLAWRLLSHKSGMNQHEMRFKRTSDTEYGKVKSASESIAKESSRILVVDGSDGGMRIEDLVATANDLVLNHGVRCLFVDHLGEILSSNSDRYDLEITRHLSLLRGVANRHSVPMVVAAHLKRQGVDPKTLQPYPPKLSDFANSSGAERKARVALGLSRRAGSDLMSIHVLKQTNGPAGQIVDVRFHGAAAMIMDAEGGIGNG